MVTCAVASAATYNGETVQFDADGNMTHGPLSGAMVSFNYDSRRRLTQAGTTQYVYDAENNRIGVNGTRFVVNSQPALSQVLVKDENGNQTFYVYGLGLIGEESAAGYRAYHFDFRGSTVALTGLDGAVQEEFRYSAYGVLLAGDASLTPFLFNGMYGVMTDANGLYHMRARFYSAEIRRFLNRDVLLGNVAEGQSLNRFGFVMGRPVSFVDLLGESATAVVEIWFLTDTAIPEPTDAAWPKWVGYGILFGGAILIDSVIMHNDEGGLADNPAPYYHYEEDEARYFIPDPFGGDEACRKLSHAIRVLRAQIAWRRTDLNPKSLYYGGHLERITLLSAALARLEDVYRNMCGGNCPG